MQSTVAVMNTHSGDPKIIEAGCATLANYSLNVDSISGIVAAGGITVCVAALVQLPRLYRTTLIQL